jgi:hypothetical protein
MGLRKGSMRRELKSDRCVDEEVEVESWNLKG